MKRKLVKQGQSTMMVSLPSKWIKKNSLDKGSEVDIDEKENKIIISGKEPEKKEITINITKNNVHDLKNILTHIYRTGFDRVILKGFNDQKSLQKMLELLLGFELVSESKTEIIIENISEPSGEKYDVMIRRVFHIIKESLNSEENIEILRNQLDKYILFCRRLVYTEKMDYAELEILNALRLIEHKLFYISKYKKENKFAENKNATILRKKLNEDFDLLYDAYFFSRIESIHKINAIRNEYYFEKSKKMLERSEGKNTVVIAYLSESFRLVSQASSPIFSKILNVKNSV